MRAHVWENAHERKFCSREKIICWIWNWEKKIPPSFLFALRVFPSKENYKTRRTITTIVSILVDLQLFRSKSKEAPWKLEEFLTQKKNFNSRLVLVHEKYQSFHKVHFFCYKKEKFSRRTKKYWINDISIRTKKKIEKNRKLQWKFKTVCKSCLSPTKRKAA